MESCSISTRTFSTKRRMIRPLILLTRLFSGLSGPEYKLPVSWRHRAQGCPLSSFHGKAACQHPCIIHVSFSPPVKAISLPFNYSKTDKLCLITSRTVTSRPTLFDDDSAIPQRLFRHRPGDHCSPHNRFIARAILASTSTRSRVGRAAVKDAVMAMQWVCVC